MSVWAEFFDLGTKMVIDPLTTAPGMDYGYYRELDFEYKWPGERSEAINDAIMDTPLFGTFRPWPEPFPWRMWVDYTDRYEGADGGLKTDFYHWDWIWDSFERVPSELGQIEEPNAYEPNVERRYERVTTSLDTDEVADMYAMPDEPTPYLRNLLYNEPGAQHGAHCGLVDPMVLTQDSHTGYEFKLVLDYNPLFAPVDMRHPEWYDLLDENGVQMPVDIKERRFALLNDAHYKIYLRPANWRWVARVWANYLYVSWFEMFTTRLVFTEAHFNRPPIYPRRHDLIHTTQTADFEYLGAEYSTDSGIDYGFNSSRSAGWLRFQIVDSQWWTQSEAFIFLYNEPATLAMWLYPPEAGDIVLGIGERDDILGTEQMFWVRQNQDLTDHYPRQVIGNYIVLDFVVAD